MSEQICEVVCYVYRAQPATLGQRVHEGMFLRRFLTSDIEAVLERELYRLDPLFGQVVGYLRDTGLQDIGQVVPLITKVPHSFFEQSDRHKTRIVAYSGEDHPAVPAITTQFFSMSSPFALGWCKVNDYFL